jgi:hypothetical protein
MRLIDQRWVLRFGLLDPGTSSVDTAGVKGDGDDLDALRCQLGS